MSDPIDGGQIVLDFSDGELADLSAADLAHRYLWGTKVDELLADERVDDGSSDDVGWVFGDHQGSVRAVARYDSATDATTVTKTIVYDAFGKVASTSGSDATTPLFLYTGRLHDSATQLQNNTNRWYDAAIGRWLSTDPIGFQGDPGNLYRYCANSPVNGRDPSGYLQIKIGGYVFYVNPTDPDPLPSDPHAHVGAQTSPIKVDVNTGDIYHKSVNTGKNIGKKNLLELRNRLRGAGLLTLATIIVLETPDIVNAAEQGGASGIAGYATNEVENAVVGTAESAAVGMGVVVAADAVGTSVTVTAGGAAITSVAGATGVGAAVIAAGGVGYYIGDEIANTKIGSRTVAEHIGENAYSAGHAVYVGATNAWNWIIGE